MKLKLIGLILCLITGVSADERDAYLMEYRDILRAHPESQCIDTKEGVTLRIKRATLVSDVKLSGVKCTATGITANWPDNPHKVGKGLTFAGGALIVSGAVVGIVLAPYVIGAGLVVAVVGWFV